MSWTSEARKVAAEWMAGPTTKLEPAVEEQGALSSNIEAAV